MIVQDGLVLFDSGRTVLADLGRSGVEMLETRRMLLEEGLNPLECIELADYMLLQWGAFRDLYEAQAMADAAIAGAKALLEANGWTVKKGR